MYTPLINFMGSIVGDGWRWSELVVDHRRLQTMLHAWPMEAARDGMVNDPSSKAKAKEGAGSTCYSCYFVLGTGVGGQSG